MKSKTITFKLVKDCHYVEREVRHRFIDNGTHFFDIPPVDLRKWKHARVEITIKDDKQDQ